MSASSVQWLADAAPTLQHILKRSLIHTAPLFAVSDIRCQSVMIAMRDGVRLATDLYLPPALPAPSVAVRTPYSRAMDAYAGVFLSLARRGYVVASQDCRGTGSSEPDQWDYYMYEPEDGYDFVEWISQQTWFNGFLGACGGSYAGQTQWQMAMHPKMSTIVPEVSGLGIAVNSAHLHMFLNAYARSVGKGGDKSSVLLELEGQMVEETLSTGLFNEPLYRPLPQSVLTRFPHLRDVRPGYAQQWLWEHYCSLPCARRAEFVKELTETTSVSILESERLSAIFGHKVSHDAHTLPHPNREEQCKSFHAPVMLRTGWYDWGLNDALATWGLLQRAAPEAMRARCRLVITPGAHNMPGYHEEMASHPDLQHAHGLANNVELLLQWYAAIQKGSTEIWPAVIYYLMGANAWCVASTWPLTEARMVPLYLDVGTRLDTKCALQGSLPDRYTYDPNDPTPTVGGSIVSYVYPPGSVDVSDVQKRVDVLMYTTPPLVQDLDVVGPLRAVLYVSSNASDTDFAARLTDVFPDGRAIQLQNGVLRARYRNIEGEPELLEPGRIYRLEIDMWATANRFKAAHRLRLDISSADFPAWTVTRTGERKLGSPISAQQTVYHDPEHPSHLMLPVIGELPRF